MSWNINTFFNIDSSSLHNSSRVGLKASLDSQLCQLLVSEEVAASSILSGVESVRYLGARLEPDHRHVILTIVSEQQHSSRLQHTEQILENLQHLVMLAER